MPGRQGFHRAVVVTHHSNGHASTDRESWCDVQREQPGKVSFDCNEELHRQEVQDAGDIRLSIVLLRTCMADKQHFCAHVPYGAHIMFLTCLAALALL